MTSCRFPPPWNVIEHVTAAIVSMAFPSTNEVH
jgi:hypothetical protein